EHHGVAAAQDLDDIGLAEFVRRRLARGPRPGTAWGMASLGIVAGGGTAGGRGTAGRCVVGCSLIAGVGSRGARRTASGSAGDRVAHAGCTVDIVGLTGGADSCAHARGNGSVIVRLLAVIGTAARRCIVSGGASYAGAHAGCAADARRLAGRAQRRAHARGNGSVSVRPLAGIGTAASRCIVSGSAGDRVAHAGCTVDVIGLTGGTHSRAHTRGYGGIMLRVLILIRIGGRGSLAGIGLRGGLGGSRFVDRCVRSIRIAMQRHPLLFGGGLGAILNVLLGVSDPGVRFHVRGPGKRRGRLVQLGCDVACLLLGSGLVTRISVDHDHFPSQTVPGAPVAMRAVTVRRTRQSLMRAVIGERMNGWTVILTWPSDRQQPPWNGTAGPVAGGCGHRGCVPTLEPWMKKSPSPSM